MFTPEDLEEPHVHNSYNLVSSGGCAEAGHSITLGSRHADSRTDLPFPVAGLNDTAQNADVIVNATPGDSSEELLAQMDADAFDGKLLIDVANAATSSYDLIYADSSLGERLQRMLPNAKVVKTLNTCAGKVFVNPSAVEGAGMVKRPLSPSAHRPPPIVRLTDGAESTFRSSVTWYRRVDAAPESRP